MNMSMISLMREIDNSMDSYNSWEFDTFAAMKKSDCEITVSEFTRSKGLFGSGEYVMCKMEDCSPSDLDCKIEDYPELAGDPIVIEEPSVTLDWAEAKAELDDGEAKAAFAYLKEVYPPSGVGPVDDLISILLKGVKKENIERNKVLYEAILDARPGNWKSLKEITERIFGEKVDSNTLTREGAKFVKAGLVEWSTWAKDPIIWK